MISRLLCIALAVSLLAGCSGGGGTTAESAAQPSSAVPSGEGAGSQEEAAAEPGATAGGDFTQISGEPLVIDYLSSDNATGSVPLSIKDVVELYNGQGGNVTMNIENISDRATYLQKVKILASSNELPTWFNADAEPYFESLCKTGIIANVGELFNELDITDKFFPMSLKYSAFEDGSLYVMSWQGIVEYFWYNKNMFAEAGITETPKTFDELKQVCQTLLDAGMTPISLGNFDMVMRYPAFVPFRMAGNEFINDARIGEQSFTNEIGQAGAQFFVDMTPYFSKGWNASDPTTQLDLFTSQQAAILYTGTWDSADLTDENMELLDFIGYFPLPANNPETDVTTTQDYYAHSGIGTAILQEAMNDEMKSFIYFLWQNYADISMYNHNTIPSLPPTIRDDLPEFYKECINALNNVNTFAHCWDVRLDAATNEVYRRELTNLGMGQITPEEFGRRMDAAVAENAPNYFDIE